MATDFTPMMRQYLAIKKQHPDAILLFRLGDFYEMFYDDAVAAARILNLTLTKRGTQKGDDVPMCGVPYHAAETYIGRLLRHNKRIAICDQVEDPRTAKGIVKRQVTRVVSPGTTFDERNVPVTANNYLVGLYAQRAKAGAIARVGVAVLDVTTGAFEVSEVPDAEMLRQELVRVQPRELLTPADMALDELGVQPAVATALVITRDALFFDDGRNVLLKHFGVLTLDGFGCEKMTCAVCAAGAVLRYVQENLPEANLAHIRALRVFQRDEHMLLDEVSRRNLELVQSLRDGGTDGTLFGVLNQTVTAMGARLLRHWIMTPLRSVAPIVQRQEAIAALMRAQRIVPTMQQTLKGVGDIERLTSRLSTGYGTPRDMAALRDTLRCLPQVRAGLQEVLTLRTQETLPGTAAVLHDGAPAGEDLLAGMVADVADVPEVSDTLARALVHEPPLKLQDGGIIREGYHAELDETRALAHSGKDWVAQLQVAEAARTGIKSLKVGYNKVFGYYIEVTKPNLPLVPPEYIRKQTVVNGERFVTPALKDMEARILHADEHARELEYDIFQQLRLLIAAQQDALQRIARALALLDVMLTLAWLALQRNYCRPQMTEDDALEIVAGRHPVVECLLPERQFVPNDVQLNTRDAQIMILTGPNMAGKSTYIRQVALLTLMAQMGSCIPAQSARIGVVDRIFTRVGASDELTRGQSTFMVEMTETANILNNATPRSLIILDEIGRGTSTYDGLAIAWSVVEYLYNCAAVKAKTLFATHYHELLQLEAQLPGIVNCNVAVREHRDTVVFLHEIVRGGSDRSYGIHVAQLAGLPDAVIRRAHTILDHLEATHQEKAIATTVAAPPRPAARPAPALDAAPPDDQLQLSLFS
jgi:DNA mismatch repair protein MutS